MPHKENRIRPESKDNVLVLEIGSRVTLDSYKNLLLPSFARVLEEHENVKFVLIYNDGFMGWDIDAAAFDLEQMTKHGRAVSKVALVNPPEVVVNRWQTLRPLIGGELRIYQADDFTEALTWAQQ